MANAREVKLRIRSIKNISQVTRALQAVSASRVHKAMDRMYQTRPYTQKAWQVLAHIAGQTGREMLHPLLTIRKQVNKVTVIMVSSDRGLAGPYNSNILRKTLNEFAKSPLPVRFISTGRKGSELLHRRGFDIMADFSDLPAEPSYFDVSAIARLVIVEFLAGNTDEVYIMYTHFINMVHQEPTVKKILPLNCAASGELVGVEYSMENCADGEYIYEPSQIEILDEILPNFTALQIYQAILESLASEHAARMVAMKNATNNASELADLLQLEYNKARQLAITSDILDIVGGAEAQQKTV